MKHLLLLLLLLLLTACGDKQTTETVISATSYVLTKEFQLPTANPYSSVGDWFYDKSEAIDEFGYEFTCEGITDDGATVYFYCDLDS